MAMIDHLVYRVKLELFFCFHNLSTTFPPYIYKLSTEKMWVQNVCGGLMRFKHTFFGSNLLSVCLT